MQGKVAYCSVYKCKLRGAMLDTKLCPRCHRMEYRFIDGICKSCTNSQSRRLKKEMRIALSGQADIAGFVYVMREPDGLYKIGESSDVLQRKGDLECELGVKLVLVYTIPCKDQHIAEAFLHRFFAHKRVKGEWFTLDDQDIAVIVQCKKM